MNTKLSHLFRRYLEVIVVFRGYSPHTARGYKHSLNAFLKFTDPEGDLRAEGISRELFERWILYGKLERKWGAKNIKNHMKAWISFLDWGISEEIFEKNYMRELPIPKQPKNLPKHLTLEESTRLMDWTKSFPYVYRFEKYRSIVIIATLMLEGGCDIFSLSKMMGHSDIKTTTIYLSATTHHLKEQIIKHPLNF